MSLLSVSLVNFCFEIDPPEATPNIPRLDAFFHLERDFENAPNSHKNRAGLGRGEISLSFFLPHVQAALAWLSKFSALFVEYSTRTPTWYNLDL